MKLPALVLLAAFAAGMAGCCRRAAAPQFAERSLDTVVRCGAVPCDLSYRFLTIANADRSEALAAIENANVNYFFALEDFTGTAEEAARRFIERFAADNACDTLYMPDMRYSLSVAAAQAPVDTLTVYTIRRESYTGGAHGMRTTEYHNYWTKGGYELSLGDLFPEEQLPRLTERIKAKLREPSTVPPMTRSSPSGVSFPKRSPRPRISRSRPKGSSSTTTPTTSPAMPSARSTYPLRRRS